jgi:hypothetical protein
MLQTVRTLVVFQVLMILEVGPSIAAQPMNQPAEKLPPEEPREPELTRDFHHDFRGRLMPEELIPYQAANGQFFRAEPEGMRITIPKTWQHPSGGLGLRANFDLMGDFEITLKFEILEIDTPPSGFGVGVGIRATKLGPNQEEFMVARMVRPQERHIVLWQRAGANGRIFSSDNAGRLRLKRSGTVLRYLWSPGLKGERFQEIFECDVGRKAFGNVRFVAMTNQKPCNLDLRLLDVRIRQGAPTPLDRSEPESEPAAANPTFRWNLLIALIVFLLLVAAGVSAAIYRRTKKERDKGSG